jgi:hypothetical protein
MIKPIKRYHPERHYMRGHGPKWLAKHGGGVDRVDAVWTTTALTSVCSQASSSSLRNAGAIRRSAKCRRNNMIRTAIVSVIASFLLVGVWTANLVSYHPATDLDPLAPLSVDWN